MISLLKRLFRRQNEETVLLIYIGKEIMTKLDDLKADVADLKVKALAAVDGLKATVEDLKSKVGQGITDADIDAVIAQVDEAKAALDADVTPPAPAGV